MTGLLRLRAGLCGVADGYHYQIASTEVFSQVVFKEYATAPIGRKFTSLFPGLGYAAGYKVSTDTTLRGPRVNELTVLEGSAKNLQVWWSAFCSRLSRQAPWLRLRPCFRKGDWQGHHARYCWKVCLSIGTWGLYVQRSLTYNSLIGIGEIVLLPLDVLKIKRQTNPEAFRGRGLFKIISDEGMGLYRGAGWTAARNAPGSFAVCPSQLG